MRIDILTLFPEMFSPVLDASILGRAQKAGILSFGLHNIRDYSENKHRTTDDYPFGGGAGMVMTAQPVFDCMENGYIPVVSTVAQGMDADTAYNINADTAAAKLAVALHAEKLILLTDVRGLLRDPSDEETLIHQARVSEIPGLIKDGVIKGGMIPKIDCSVEAVRSGVHSTVILDGRIPHSILIELLSDEGVGTMLVQ